MLRVFETTAVDSKGIPAARWDKIRSLFDEAIDLDPARRAEWRRRVEREDPELLREVETLIAAEAGAAELFALLEAAPGRQIRMEAAPLSEGTRIGRYGLLSEIGRGGMGVVYLARDPVLDRLVALKCLSPELSTEAKAKSRLLEEARAAAALDHPNIATVYEVGETEPGQLFIALAYYEGGSLKQRLDRGPLSLELSLDLAGQVALGLEAAHEKGIVHRDIKPGNILVTPGGLVKIVDFGLAVQTKSEATRSINLTGTLPYMSPEQLRGEDADHRSDLWSLGVVFYEMITGQKPFPVGSTAGILYAILGEQPAPLSAHVQDLPQEAQRVLDRALAKNLKDRYQRAADFRADLTAIRRSGDPVLSSAASVRLPRGNLPAPLTSFVGRARELSDLKTRLAAARLVSLIGPPGTGKTRLALQVAHEVLGDFEDGAYFVPLAAVSQPALVASAIAQTMGVREAGGRPVLECLTEALRSREMLLVLDNFEQIVEAAPTAVQLLGCAPRLKILVTSRESLRVGGEQEFPVPPLQLPASAEWSSLEELQQNEAVILLMERTRTVKPDFALDAENAPLLAEICTRLDGLPLAIELAAARLKVLTPKSVLARLAQRLKFLTSGARDVPGRHQTLREAIGWSYELLSREEQRLLRRLSVFVGGFTLETAEEISMAPGPVGIELLDGLASLVDKNLLRQESQPDGESRFLMLSTIQEFAQECLTAAGEADPMRRAHGDLFLQLSESAKKEITGPEQAGWLDRLEREHDNLRAALEWAQDTDWVRAANLAGAIWRFWLVRGYITEGRERLEQLLLRSSDQSPPALRAHLRTAAGTMAHNQGLYAAARASFEESLDIFRSLHDQAGIAQTLNNLGWVAWRQGRYGEARELSEESLALHRELGDSRGVAHALNNLGWVAHHEGDFSSARELHEQCLTLQQQLGDKRGVAFARTNLAWALSMLGENDRAARLLEEALALHDEVGEKQLGAFSRTLLAGVVLAQGNAGRAKELVSQGISVFRHIGDKYGLALALCTFAQSCEALGDEDRAESLLRESLAVRAEIGDRWGFAQSLSRLASLALRAGASERGKALFRESLAVREEIGDRHGIAECLAGLDAIGS